MQKFNPNDMTVRDLDDFQRIVGVEYEDLVDDKGNLQMPKGKTTKVLHALALIVGRKEDPSFTEDDALDVKITDLVGVSLEEEVEEAPLVAPKSGSASRKKPAAKPAPKRNSQSPSSSA